MKLNTGDRSNESSQAGRSHRDAKVAPGERIAHALVPVAVASLAILMAGCDLVGVVADKVAGARPVPPAHVPDKTKSMIVIAENYRDGTRNASDAQRLSSVVTQDFVIKTVAPMIPPERLQTLRDKDPAAYRKMSVLEIAKAVNAQQVLYIDMGAVGVGTQPGSDALKGVSNANVKLIDVASGTVIFPKDQDAGAPVAYESKLYPASREVTPDRVRGQAIVGLGEQIGRLFHEYLPTDLERLGDGEEFYER